MAQTTPPPDKVGHQKTKTGAATSPDHQILMSKPDYHSEMSGPETISTVPTKTHTDLAIKAIPQIKSNYKKLPKFLLSNIQSFGSSENTDKTTEVEVFLDLNDIVI